MKGLYPIAQFLLRCALGIGFLLPVLDRLGYFGAAGSEHVAWGDWPSFVAYTHQLMPYLGVQVASFFGFIATCLEVLFGILLLAGYKTRLMALGSSGLTLVFALSMLLFLHFRAPFNYSVFVVSFSGLLLASGSRFPWSIDAYLERSRKNPRANE
ncbi:DoxX family protein [Taibaiella chishuiensis]|uniref:Putative membrane protein YphA (DoxX/SURF4 family) n=1 Tax=Taibaiella chishuiensis TaxID=1434707 RepID=A0A2P8DBP2_9BACT|nr:DoxX family protein [Taibaiella chishuiensis]PSK94632.1 putative membrane protein YphA (DoxX/SURF4 family) [Taibaiella chishuiensis]